MRKRPEDFSVIKKYCPVLKKNIAVKVDHENGNRCECLNRAECNGQCRNTYL
ncbi:MAG: hypothetical protein MR284_00630 [Clostridiales bacterium]|nr:hypothetical protein [Clostridiales bacterium]